MRDLSQLTSTQKVTIKKKIYRERKQQQKQEDLIKDLPKGFSLQKNGKKSNDVCLIGDFVININQISYKGLC